LSAAQTIRNATRPVKSSSRETAISR